MKQSISCWNHYLWRSLRHELVVKKNIMLWKRQSVRSTHICSYARSYLGINVKWVSGYVRDEVRKVYDFHIAEFSKDYRNIDMIHFSCNVPNIDGNVCLELPSPHPAASTIHDNNWLFVVDIFCILRRKPKAYLVIKVICFHCFCKILKTLHMASWDEESNFTWTCFQWTYLQLNYVSFPWERSPKSFLSVARSHLNEACRGRRSLEVVLSSLSMPGLGSLLAPRPACLPSRCVRCCYPTGTCAATTHTTGITVQYRIRRTLYWNVGMGADFSTAACRAVL